MGWDISPYVPWWISSVEAKRVAGERKYGVSAAEVFDASERGEDVSAFTPEIQLAEYTGYMAVCRWSHGW